MMIQGTATSYIDLAQVISATVLNNGVSAVAIVGGGTGYTVGDILTVSGGTSVGPGAATLEVTSVSSGVIDGIKVKMAGAYSTDPTNAVSVTGGTGNDDATFNLTMTGYGWTVERDTTHSGSDREIILNGNGAGSDEIFVGIRTYNDTSVFNWELAGFTGYTSALAWENQPGISPGREDQSDVTGGAFVALATTASQSLEYWIQIDSYAIAGVVRNGTSYQSFYMGWLNPFGTASEFTYPLCIAGNTSDVTQAFNDTDIFNSGISDPINHSDAGGAGPMLYRNGAGQWQTYMNGFASRTIQTNRVTFPTGNGPTGSPGTILEQDLTFQNDYLFSGGSSGDIIPQSANPGVATYTLAQTPDSGGDQSSLWPITLVNWEDGTGLQGELRGVYWVHNDGGIVAEDDFRISGVDYRVFQAGTRTNNWAFWALREN